jgi:hypothetical protein
MQETVQLLTNALSVRQFHEAIEEQLQLLERLNDFNM